MRISKNYILLILLFVFITLDTYSQTANQLNQIKKIQTQWTRTKRLFIQDNDFFNEFPFPAAPYKAGSLKIPYLKSAIDMTNFVRMLAELPKVQFSTSLNHANQFGAVMLAKLGQVNHYPQKPANMKKDFFDKAYESTSSSNIYLSSNINDNLINAILSWMHDSNGENISTLENRRWILNPPLYYVGFGQSHNKKDVNMITMAAKDESSKSKFKLDYVAWPTQNLFPLEFFKDTQAWSVSLNTAVYDNSKTENIKVTLTDTSTKKSWIFNSSTNNDATSEANTQYFNVDTVKFGLPYCIIFRPDNATYTENKTFKVKVEGIYSWRGNKDSFTYSVTFFKLEK